MTDLQDIKARLDKLVPHPSLHPYVSDLPELARAARTLGRIIEEMHDFPYLPLEKLHDTITEGMK